MSGEESGVRFERLTEIGDVSPTLVEGMPGFGLVAAIAADQITRQLGLVHHGNVVSESFPPVLAFQDGRARDAVRVYAGTDPAVMTLRSDVALPPESFPALADCVLEDLADEFERAVFLAGAPAWTEDEIGEVTGVATTDALADEMREAGVELTEGIGLVGGVTGALANECYHADVPTAVLIVKANPFLPDPTAARALIENALEPLVGFDVDTTELQEEADAIQRQMQQMAEQMQQQQGADQLPPDAGSASMYQ